MIYDLFAFKLLLAFAGGWIVVAMVTTMADIYGTGKAGFLGGIPSTGAVSLLFIGLSQSQQAAVTAVGIFPLAFSVSFAFLLFYSWSGRWSFGKRMAVALSLWLILSALISASGLGDFVLDLVGGIVLSAIIFIFHRRLRIQDVPPMTTMFSLLRVVLRGILGGLVVVSVVVLTVLLGPLAGGVFTAAPAIWGSSLFITNRTHGLEFSRAITKSFMKTGILTVIPFGVAARYLFSAYGIWWGTLFSYAAIVPLAWFAWRLAGFGR